MDDPRRVAILGVTGFIGRGLPECFARHGLATTGISRAPASSFSSVAQWQTLDRLDLAGHEAVINLAGAPIYKRWTTRSRKIFHDSRVGVTRQVVEAIRMLPPGQRPKVLVNGSAVGIYGDRGDEVLTETSERGDGYLADLCHEWEEAALEAQALGVRVVCLRIGVVLGRDGEAFGKMLRLFRLGMGGRLGNGQQWMPWIHIDDIRAAAVHAVLSETLVGPANGVAPVAERNVDLTRKLASALHRPALLPVPGFALKLALGGFGGALLAGQHAQPAALGADGFSFRYPTLESALSELID